MKKETLEEAAERLYPVNNTGDMFMANRDEINNSLKQEGFIDGYKLQQDQLVDLVNQWQKRQHDYEYVAEKYKDHPFNNRKFVYKALATRDCWKELLTLIQDKDE